ncbi:MAG TPA: SPOR domain-containing protein [Candidatus Eisenbacteria bacterium]
MTEPDLERYADLHAFAWEVNLPLLGEVVLESLPPGAGLAEILRAPVPSGAASIVTSLAQTRQSLTLRSLLLAGYAHDPELFALGLAIARDWGRRGLRMAVVDLNFWSPAVVRPAEEPSEGLVDMLEFGCSFRRVAWEVVADRLWIVTPGSYLPDPERIVDHVEWDRVGRVLAGAVDVALYVAPLLERSGFLGRLSKRMDGAIVGSAVERVPRTRLRDSFLELWGSDAPMIGCVGILPAAPPAPGEPAPAPAVAGEPVAPPQPHPTPAARLEAPPPKTAEAPPSRPAEAPPPPRPEPITAREREAEWDDSLVETLTREALEGAPPPVPTRGPRLRAWFIVASVLLLSGAAGLAWVRLHPFGLGVGAFRETTPTGTDEVLPAGLGSPAGERLPAAGRSDSTASLSGPSAGPAEGDALPFHVHVASFRSADTVQQIVDNLRAHDLDAWYEPAPGLPGWYRVLVGRYATYQDAALEARSLLERRLVDRARPVPERPR